MATTLGLLAGPASTVLGHRAAQAVTCNCICKVQSVHDSLIWGGNPADSTVTQFSITLEPVTQLATASNLLSGSLSVKLSATATLHATYTITGKLNGSPFSTQASQDMDIKVDPAAINHSTKVKCPPGVEFTNDKFSASLTTMLQNAETMAKSSIPGLTHVKVSDMTLSFIGGSVKTNVLAASTCGNSNGPGTIPLTGWPGMANGTDFFDYKAP